MRASDILELSEMRDKPSVTILMPRARAGGDTKADPIRLRNLLDKAEAELESTGVRGADARSILELGRTLLSDTRFWMRGGAGLSLFLSPKHHSIHELPLDFSPTVVVADGFHVRPLLRLLQTDGVFYVLAISKDDVRLVQSTREQAAELPIEEAPDSMQEALRFKEFETHQQHHVADRPAGGRTALFHGHGVGVDDDLTDVEDFFRQVDGPLLATLGEERRRPLVLACVERHAPVFRRVSDHPNVLDGVVEGNPEMWGPDELRQRAWPIVEPEFKRRQAEDRGGIEDLSGSDRRSDVLLEVLPAALSGRVDALFIDRSAVRWGRLDRESQSVEPSRERRPGDVDLLNEAAVATAQHDGRVYFVPEQDLPAGIESGDPLAAALRW
ncbi:MAG: hypothetical protein VYC34_02220 [Planctomycetota bacterium]|nr:hypothetical protein [Planctomycetota bacterium]